MSKYYHETSTTMILNSVGRNIIDQELERIKPVCEICGTELIRISMMEGDSIICPVDMYKHLTDWRIISDYQNDNLPELRNCININETAIETSRRRIFDIEVGTLEEAKETLVKLKKEMSKEKYV